MKVALFIPCITEHLLPDAGISMVKVLEHLGVEVEYVENQTCCGQPAFNAGYHDEVIPMAEHFIELFADKDYIIAPSGSCVGMVRVHYDRLPLSDKAKSNYKNLQSKIFEFTEFLVNVMKVKNIGGSFNHRVTYHQSCHLGNELGIVSQPRDLIKSIDNIDFVEMENPDICCGFGGTFSYKQEDISLSLVEQKANYIEATGAEYCIGADSSCLMNIDGYLKTHNMKARTMHISELLAKSLGL
jgi:L-lactate dehydrogenase complex protein LldE